MTWPAPTSRSSGGRSAVSTTSGTPASRASWTAGRVVRRGGSRRAGEHDRAARSPSPARARRSPRSARRCATSSGSARRARAAARSASSATRATCRRGPPAPSELVDERGHQDVLIVRLLLLHGFTATGRSWDPVRRHAGRATLPGRRHAGPPRALARRAGRRRCARPSPTRSPATRWAGGSPCSSRSPSPTSSSASSSSRRPRGSRTRAGARGAPRGRRAPRRRARARGGRRGLRRPLGRAAALHRPVARGRAPRPTRTGSRTAPRTSPRRSAASAPASCGRCGTASTS